VETVTNSLRGLGLAAGAAIEVSQSVVALAISPVPRGHILRYWLDSEPDSAFRENQADNIHYWSDFGIELRDEIVVGDPDLGDDSQDCVFVYCRDGSPSERFPKPIIAWYAAAQADEALLLLTNRACLGRVEPTNLDSVAVIRDGDDLQLEARFRSDSEGLRKGIECAASGLSGVVGRSVEPVFLQAARAPRAPDSNVRMTTFLSGFQPES